MGQFNKGWCGTAAYEPLWMAWYWPGYSPLIEDASASILQPGPSGLASVCRRRTSSALYVGASLLTIKRIVCPGRTLKRSLYPTIFIKTFCETADL